jgi:hypothetical protein
MIRPVSGEMVWLELQDIVSLRAEPNRLNRRGKEVSSDLIRCGYYVNELSFPLQTQSLSQL